jgi:hypothetical protein
MELNGFCTGAWWQPGAIAVNFRTDAGDDVAVSREPGVELELAISDDRFCSGYRLPLQPVTIPCPHKAVASQGTQCEDCFKRTDLLHCMRCKGERCMSKQWWPDCKPAGSHAVYLANYANGPGFMKIGVAKWDRRVERVSEQGAREALIIARADGLEARRLEAAIDRMDAKKRGIEGITPADQRRIKDRLTQSQRLAAWQTPSDRDLLLGELYRRLAEIHRRIVNPFFLKIDDIEELDLPELPTLNPSPRMLHQLGGMKIRGTVDSIYAETLIIDADSGERLALDVKSLRGYKIRPLAQDEDPEDQLALVFD